MTCYFVEINEYQLDALFEMNPKRLPFCSEQNFKTILTFNLFTYNK